MRPAGDHEPERMPRERRYVALFVVMSALLIAPVAYHLAAARQAALDDASADATNLARVLANQFEGSMHRVEELVNRMADDIDRKAMRRDQVGHYEAEIAKAFAGYRLGVPEVAELQYLGADGMALYRSGPRVIDPPASMIQRNFERLRASGSSAIFFSEAFAGPDGRGEYICIGRPVRDIDGAFRGTACVDYDLSSLRSLLGRIDLGAGGVVGIVRIDTGVFAFRYPHPAEPGDQNMAATPVRKAVLQGKTEGEATFAAPMDGATRLHAFRSIEGFPYFVYVALAENDYLMHWRQERNVILAVVLMLELLMALGLVRLARLERRRQAAEEALRESHDTLATFIEALPDAAVLKDADGRWQMVNETTRRFFRLDGVDWRGKSDAELAKINPLLAGTHLACIDSDRKAWATRTSSLVLERFPGTDGRLQTHEVRKVPLFHPDGRRRGLMMIGHDVTDRIETTDRLRLLSEAIEQNPAKIVIADRQGRIEYVNEAMVRQSGYAAGELIGQNARIVGGDDMAPPVRAQIREAVDAGRTWRGELENSRKDGTRVVDMATLIPIRQADGSVSHYLGVMEDVTEQKRMAEELDRHRFHLQDLVRERTEQLQHAMQLAESASRAKTAFLANMSHEIRTPLNAISGLAHLVEQEGVSATQAERLLKLEQASAHLLGIVDDVLDLSKIEAGKLTLAKGALRIPSLIDGVAAMLGARLHGRDVKLRVELDGFPADLQGDPGRLKQALLNYANNAVKFTRHGSITLRARLLEQGDHEVLVRFEVADTGIGIAPDALPRLFAPFEQADSSTTRRFGGSGLGLAITRSLARLMGGEAGVESELGQGSTFWFTARLSIGAADGAGAPEADREAAAKLRQGHSGRRVLLAEDDPINREVALHLLEQAALAVDVAEDGFAAIELAARNHYDLVLMDMQMPGADGLEATRRIRATARGAHVPIVAVTANAFSEDRAACRRAGMDDFLPKPVHPDQLYTIVLRWLSGGLADAAGAARPAPRTGPAAL